jgi:phosphocarrier protein FPr
VKSVGGTYTDNIGFDLKLDLNRMLGGGNTTFLLKLSQRDSDSVSEKYVAPSEGGNTFTVQEIYGGQTFKVANVQFNTLLLDDRLDLAYGRLVANDDFLRSPLYCQFVNNSFCGSPKSVFLQDPFTFSAYPTSQWGVRGRYDTESRDWTIQGAIYDGDPENKDGDPSDSGNNKHGTNWVLSGEIFALLLFLLIHTIADTIAMDENSNTLELSAPLSGFLMPLEQVPDPVFSQKMVGDGISIDPTSQTLCAPCDGKIIQLHSAHHAITIASKEGAEIMMHIGLDTVDLKGEGFTVEVSMGDQVRRGDPLITFDADLVACKAKSLLTQIVITNSDILRSLEKAEGLVTTDENIILTLKLADVAAVSVDKSSTAITSEAVLIPNHTGLHARPAAVLANMAKQFKSDIRLRKGEMEANAKSVVSIMGLDVAYQDKVMLAASGVDAQAALDKLLPELTNGLGDEGTTPAPAPASTMADENSAPPPQPRSEDPNLLLGAAASPGLAMGKVFQIRPESFAYNETADDSREQQRRLEHAIEQAKIQLEALQAKLHGQKQTSKAAIFAAHQELLEDPDLIDIALSAIAKGKSAEFSWDKAFTAHANRLAAMKNELLAGRANDLRDVGKRILRLLTGQNQETPQIPPESILVAEELSPSDTANLDRTRVLGFCTLTGGATSHVAILARAMDIPAVAGIEPRALELENGSQVILDGGKGQLRINPTDSYIDKIWNRQQQMVKKKAADLALAHQPAITTDGHQLEVVANIGNVDDALQGIEMGAEGVGLLRSEFLYLDRATAPTEDEQYEIYRAVIEALGPDRPLIIRTLDIGGDKPLPYLPMPREENPFLGERGIRIGLNKPQMLRTQMRAVLRAGQGFKMRIMFPMIATLDEMRDARAILEEERQRLSLQPIEVGIMVEVPSTAIMATQFAREVDFFSIGTNDLTQYTLAMDRGHPKLASKADPLNPAVLKLIQETVTGANTAGKWVGVCGGIASDPQAIPVLVGLGISELSASVPSIPAVKAAVRACSLEQCRKLTDLAVHADNANEVRELVSNSINSDISNDFITK